MIDIHSHILPGLDDGASSVEESLRMCAMASRDGVTAIVATPHDRNGVYENPRARVLSAVDALYARIKEAGIPIGLLPGADVHLDAGLLDALGRREVMTLGDGGKFILVEPPALFVPEHLKRQIFDLRLLGLVPIITHPERTGTLQGDLAPLYDFIAAGALCQITAGSLTGRFGRPACKLALTLVELRMAHIIASDAHDEVRRPPLLSEAASLVEKTFGPDTARALLHDTPAAILSGEVPTLAEPITRTRRSIFSFFTGR